MKKTAVAEWDALKDRKPEYALVANVDLIVVRFDDQVSVLYGRCQHRGALMCDGHVAGHNLICGVLTHTFINKDLCSEPLGGQPARRVGASIARLW